MISSMTAFARKSTTAEWGQATWELRSVNHRYLDISVYLPEGFAILEPVVRNHLKHQLKRGKVDCRLKLRLAGSGYEMSFNQTLVKQLAGALAEINKICQTEAALQPHFNGEVLLSWPGVLTCAAMDIDAISQPIVDLFDEAVNALVAMREQEGAALMTGFEQRLDEIEHHLAAVNANSARINQTLAQNLRERISALAPTVDESRLLQEVAIGAQKLDIAEECDRLQTHVKSFRQILTTGGVVGRRLDFLLQEFNREANTIASKSVLAQTSQHAVDLKVLIEQIREQVQNIE